MECDKCCVEVHACQYGHQHNQTDTKNGCIECGVKWANVECLNAVLFFQHEHCKDKHSRKNQQYGIDGKQHFAVGKVSGAAFCKWKVPCVKCAAGQCEIIENFVVGFFDLCGTVSAFLQIECFDMPEIKWPAVDWHSNGAGDNQNKRSDGI